MALSAPARRLALLALALALATPAAAQVTFDAVGSVNLIHERATLDEQGTSHADAHPELTMVFGSPRLVWRARYAFSGALLLHGAGDDSSYANDLGLAAAAQPTPRTTLVFAGGAAQGSTARRTILRETVEGEPTLRGPDDPDRVSANLSETFSWDATPRTRLSQALGASASAPQGAVEEFLSHVVSASLTLDRMFPRNTLGVRLESRYAVLRPLERELPPTVEAVVSAAQVVWRRDLDPVWSTSLAAGAEHVTAPSDLERSVHPTGAVNVRYIGGKLSATVTYDHGAEPNLEEGTMSLSDALTGRATWTLRPSPLRELSGAIGLLRARALDEAGAASTSGDSLHAEAELAWGLTALTTLRARYGLDRQVGRRGGPGSTIHVLTVGFAIRTSPRTTAPRVPTPGSRVDGSDAVTFPGPPPGG